MACNPTSLHKQETNICDKRKYKDRWNSLQAIHGIEKKRVIPNKAAPKKQETIPKWIQQRNLRNISHWWWEKESPTPITRWLPFYPNDGFWLADIDVHIKEYLRLLERSAIQWIHASYLQGPFNYKTPTRLLQKTKKIIKWNSHPPKKLVLSRTSFQVLQ